MGARFPERGWTPPRIASKPNSVSHVRLPTCGARGTTLSMPEHLRRAFAAWALVAACKTSSVAPLDAALANPGLDASQPMDATTALDSAHRRQALKHEPLAFGWAC